MQIYKCDEFPFKWSYFKTIFKDIKLLDATWIFHEKKYWLFANEISNFEYDNNEKLNLYYSDDLFSNKWIAHVQNPVVTNIQSARNAGNIYIENSKMYRPSQNSNNSYGNYIVINEILSLTTSLYSEEIVSNILPNKLHNGMHTYNKYRELTIVDYLVQE